MGESGWQILRAEADDLRRSLKNVHEGRERAIERAREAESLNTRYREALERLADVVSGVIDVDPSEVRAELTDLSQGEIALRLANAEDQAREALAPDTGTEDG